MIKQNDIQPILKALFVFEVVAREMNFTKAAQHLGVPQPSVSRYMANLEAFIETPLFLRRHNKIEMTEAGDTLFKATELGLAHIRTVIDNLTLEKSPDQLTIACTHGFAHMWVLPRVERLRSIMPNWDIRLNTSEQPPDAEAHDADIVIRFGTDDWPETRSTLIFEEEVFPVCAPAMLAKLGVQSSSVTPAKLSGMPLIVQDYGDFGWMSWSKWFRHFDIEHHQLPDRHPVPSYHFVLQAATEGKGVALAWSHLIEPYLSNGWLVELPNMRARTDKGYYVTYAEGHEQAHLIEQWLAGAAL